MKGKDILVQDTMRIVEYLKQKGKAKFQEKIAEYAFLKDLLISAAINNQDLLVSRSDFDAFGYDVLVQEKSGKTVYIQIKTYNGKASVWDIHKSLLSDPNGTVILIQIAENKLGDDLDFVYHIIDKSKINNILVKPPKEKHLDKCRTNKGDYVKIEDVRNLYNEIFNPKK